MMGMVKMLMIQAALCATTWGPAVRVEYSSRAPYSLAFRRSPAKRARHARCVGRRS
jgi:hypothetical protein